MENKKVITIFINEKKLTAWEGQTIMEVAEKNGIKIPSLCYHPDLKVQASCRLCVVEIEGESDLKTACNTKVFDGMEIKTSSDRIEKARKINLELLFTQHEESCKDCVVQHNCKLLNYSKDYKINISRFFDRKKKYKDYKFDDIVSLETSKCIDCNNCVEVCKNIGAEYLEYKLHDKKNNFFHVVPTEDKDKDCIYCGQCINHCPSGAFEAAEEFEKILEPIGDKDKFVVVQFSPGVGASIGEDLGFTPGHDITGQLIKGIRKLGVNYVFNTGVGTDVSLIEQAKEFLDRVESPAQLPMISSHCPSWAKYAEMNYPELIPHLSPVKSPHLVQGGLLKTYWAKDQEIDPANIVVISVLPCISAKHEILRDDLSIDGLGMKIKPVDYVMSVRELAFLLTQGKIDVKKLKNDSFDPVFSKISSGALNAEKLGGTLKAVFPTAYEMGNNKKFPKIRYRKSKIEGVMECMVSIEGKEIRGAYVDGIKNANRLIKKLEEKRSLYDFVEILVCPGGCLGGGGQPVPTSKTIVKSREKALKSIGDNISMKRPYDSPLVNELYEEFFEEEWLLKAICNRKFGGNR